MAFLGNYDYDVFISYAHVDNVPRAADEAGWVDNFCDAIRRHLPKHLPASSPNRSKLSIFMDGKLEGNDEFDPTLQNVYERSAVIVSVLSPNYVGSKWCLREVDGFTRVREPRIVQGGRVQSRVLKVVLSGVPDDKQPKALFATNGYRFFDHDPQTGHEVQFRRTIQRDPDQRYWNQVEAIARDIGGVLETLAKPAAAAAVATASDPNLRVVYLAEVTDDLEDDRRQIKTALEQRGILVIPELRLPTQAPALDETIVAALQRAEMSIHLVGRYPRQSADGGSVIQLQKELADRVGSKRALRQMICLAQDLEVEHIRAGDHRAFIEALHSREDERSPVEVLKATPEMIREQVLQRLFPPTPTFPRRRAVPALVYLTHMPEDRTDAERLSEWIRAANHDVALPAHGTDPKAQMRDHKARLRGCNAALVLYGSAPVTWARDRAFELRDFAQQRRRNPILATYVCDAPPEEKPDLGLKLSSVPVLPCRQGLAPDHLEPFLDALRRRAEAN